MFSASLDELRAFTAVFETGGFTAAAKRLTLTTNAVSLRIQKLEAGLGVRLFVRTTRSVSPTDDEQRQEARGTPLAS
jgi:DNA-binding transcriptional LysR family regulator